jgi:hypothetical protein
MNDVATQAGLSQRLNHVECVYRPGERDVAYALFELMGFTIFDYADGEVYVAAIDAATFRDEDNDNYIAGRAARPEQWAFDQALEKALTQAPLAEAYAKHQAMLAATPQWGMHFGLRLNSPTDWEAAVARLEDVNHLPALLRGRVRLLKAFRPGDPDQPFDLYQAFIWTDVIASGSLALGQRIELTTFIR